MVIPFLYLFRQAVGSLTQPIFQGGQLTAQLTQVQNRYEMIQSLINLYTALGGFGNSAARKNK